MNETSDCLVSLTYDGLDVLYEEIFYSCVPRAVGSILVGLISLHMFEADLASSKP